MSIVVIGGGPRPNARIVGMVEEEATSPNSYAIIDGNEVLAIFGKISHAKALLPLIQSGE